MSLLCAVTHRKEDAARKWCPFAWTRNPANCGENGLPCEECSQDPEQHHLDNFMATGSLCLTTRCMAWVDETDYFHGLSIGRCGLVPVTCR